MNIGSNSDVSVVVFDDQLERHGAYQKFFQVLNRELEGKWKFDVRYCWSIGDVANLGPARGPRLAIVDMVLMGDGWPTDAVSRLDRKLRLERWPLLLVSARFDSSPAIQRANLLIGDDWDGKQPCQFVMWPAVLRASEGLEATELAFIIDYVLSRATGQDLQFKKGLNDPVGILHLTDPHFGKAKWDAGALITLRAARDRRGFGLADFVAITGDIADKGIPVQYQSARAYIETMASVGLLEGVDGALQGERVLMVPGNHDFCRSVALSANIAGEKEYSITEHGSADGEWMRDLGWVPYFDFEASICQQRDRWLPKPGFRVTARFCTAGIVFLEMNVEQFAIGTYQHGMTTGELRRAFNDALEAVARVRNKGACVVVLAHRQEVNGWSESYQVVESALRGLAADGPVVLLTGHDHTERVAPEYANRVLVVRGVPPSKGAARRELELPQVKQLVLRRQDGRVRCIEVETFHLSASGWLSSEDGTHRYEWKETIWSALP